jgi:mandelate racemase
VSGKLRVEKQGAVGWIVFDQPAKKNAINGAMWRAIPPAMQDLDADPQVRCVAFRGEGTEAFAAGADISEFEKVRADKGAVSAYDDLLDQVLHAIQDSRKPSVAMIHGFCLGGGLEIALACDLRYCGQSAQFGIPAAKLGLAYNVEGHKRIIETVGHARAREIMFLGRRYPADEARDGAGRARAARCRARGLCRGRAQDAERKRAPGDRQLQGHHRGVRQVLRLARREGHARGDGALHQERGLQGGPKSLHGEAQTAVPRLMKIDKLKIRAIRVRAVAAPMKRPLQTSTGAVSVAPLLLIDLQTDGGLTGRSYLFGIGRNALAPIAALVEGMAEMVKGDALAPFDIEKKLRARHTLLGVHNIVLFAMAGIDMAAWDALAQALGQPLVRVLGAAPRPILAYNSKGLGIMEERKVAKEAAELVGEGFSAVKLRLGRPDARADIAALRAVKKAIGPDVTLMVDFNQALTVAEAKKRGRMIDAEGGVHWIEEPIRADDFAGCRSVREAVQTPIQIGENFMGPEQAAQAIAAGACDYVMPDAQRIGGVTGWMRAAALAQGAGMEMSSHLFPEVSCHLLAATPTCHWLEYVDWADAILEEPARLEKGRLLIPETPGVGMRWNEKAVKRYAV